MGQPCKRAAATPALKGDVISLGEGTVRNQHWFMTSQRAEFPDWLETNTRHCGTFHRHDTQGFVFVYVRACVLVLMDSVDTEFHSCCLFVRVCVKCVLHIVTDVGGSRRKHECVLRMKVLFLALNEAVRFRLCCDVQPMPKRQQ